MAIKYLLILIYSNHNFFNITNEYSLPNVDGFGYLSAHFERF